MAELTVHKFFDIQRKIEDGLDLDGATKQYDVEKCTTTRTAVKEALEQVGIEHPELHDCMRVAAAMLARLDTIRAEARLHLSGARHKALQGNADQAATAMDTVMQVLGNWDDSHTLYVH